MEIKNKEKTTEKPKREAGEVVLQKGETKYTEFFRHQAYYQLFSNFFFPLPSPVC